MLSICKKKPRSAISTSIIRPIKTDEGFQFSLRLKTLIDKKRVIQSRAATHSKAPANYVALFEGFQQFDGDLNKLQVGSHIKSIFPYTNGYYFLLIAIR